MDGVEALNRVAVDLDQATRKVSKQVEQIVRASGQQLVRQAQQFAPVDTGALRTSIGVDVTGNRKDELTATAGPTVSYAPFLEHGTSRMAPHAFMGPALDRVAPDFAAALEAAADPLP